MTFRVLHAISVLIALCGVLNASAQWQLEPGVPDVDYYGVEQFDDQLIHGAGQNHLLRTEDNGTNWDTIHLNVFGGPFPGLLHDVHFFDAQTGVATGLLSTVSQYIVLRTTNGGQNWTPTYTSSGGGPVCWLEDLQFGSTTEGYAVGLYNRLIRTTDAGASWQAVSTPGSGHLYAFQYGDGLVRHIAGDGRILRSTNGGTNWTAMSFPEHDLRGMHFPSASRGYAVGEDGSFLRTDDAGLSWTAMTGPFADEDLTDVFFTSDDVGYVTSDGRIWRTTTGGTYWEWFPCIAPLHAITFFNGEGIAVGEEGTIYRTTGGTMGYTPTAEFSISPAAHCEDSLVVLTNLSDPSLTSTWYYNGEFLANTPNTSLVISEPQQVDTIMLVVSNGSMTDTLVRAINIAASLEIEVEAALVQDTLCQGGSTQVQVPASISGVSYRLRRGSTPIGTAQTGNGDTLSFNTGTINGPDTLNIFATRTVLGCGIATDSTYMVLYNATPIASLTAIADPGTICAGDGGTVVLPVTEPGILYQLKQGTQNIGPQLTANGGQLTFLVPALTTTTTFTIQASHPIGCQSTLAQSVTIVVEQPSAHFAISSWNPEVGVAQSTVNTSTGVISWLWDFGVGASPASSTLPEPAVTFDMTGPRTIILIATSPLGCTDTAMRAINVLDVVELEDCMAAQGYSQGGRYDLRAVRFGNNGDVFALLSHGASLDFKVHSNHQDTLVADPFDPTSDFEENHRLIKFDHKGVPQWMTEMRYESWPADLGDIAVDAEGNIYVTFFHNYSYDSLLIYNTDGQYNGFTLTGDGSLLRSAVVMSWDPMGMYRWHDTFLEHYTLWNLNMALDGEGSLYVCSEDSLLKYDAQTGNRLWTVTHEGFNPYRHVAVDANGDPWVAYWEDVLVEHYSPDGDLIGGESHAEMLPSAQGNSRTMTEEMEIAPDGTIYVAGYIQGVVRLGTDTLEDEEPGFLLVPDHFITRIDPVSGVEWTVEMDASGPGNGISRGFTLSNGHLLMSYTGQDITLSAEGNPPLTMGEQDHALLHVNENGGDVRLEHLLEPGLPGTNYTDTWDLGLATEPGTGRIAALVGLNSTNDFGNTTLTQHPAAAARDFALLLGEVDCFSTTLPGPTATPVSYFDVEEPVCAWAPVQFSDLSLNDPTSWAWSFPGGDPATSNDQSPVVTYGGQGTYTATLTASNANGAGTTWTGGVVIDVCTAVQTTDRSAITLGQTVVGDLLVIYATGPSGERYVLRDMQGRIVAEGTLTARTDLDVRQLAAGSYTVRVGGTGHVARFVVAR